ncbi:hypothetical protein B0H14DRAFT_661966 [Mycena olivaceomarginata]|nr:hypothetical protein B0H14DRAFT_661966 [Mycena olivaceomarginata]
MSLRLLKNMAKAPTEFYQHIPRFPASLVFALAFGREMKHYELAEVQRILADFVFEINPGAHLIDTFPVLDLLPDFLSPWRDEARRKRVLELSLYSGLCLEVQRRMEEDPELECFTARLGDQQEKFNMSNEKIFYIASTASASGTGTSAATMLWFVMAVVLYPEAAKKARLTRTRSPTSRG